MPGMCEAMYTPTAMCTPFLLLAACVSFHWHRRHASCRGRNQARGGGRVVCHAQCSYTHYYRSPDLSRLLHFYRANVSAVPSCAEPAIATSRTSLHIIAVSQTRETERCTLVNGTLCIFPPECLENHPATLKTATFVPVLFLVEGSRCGNQARLSINADSAGVLQSSSHRPDKRSMHSRADRPRPQPRRCLDRVPSCLKHVRGLLPAPR